jgi:serine/threonine protein kinase
MDFGLSYFAETSNATCGESLPAGTLRFMAPELIHPDNDSEPKRTFASDIYAFGCVAYQVINISPTLLNDR